jgi:hypothetical protein
MCFVLAVEAFESIDVLLDDRLERDSEDVVEVVTSVVGVEVLGIVSKTLVRESVELIGDFSEGLAREEIVLLAVEVDAHEVHLNDVANILFGGLIAVEEAGLVVLVDSLCRNLVDLYPEGVVFLFVLASEVDALDLDVHIIEQVQKPLINETVLLFVLLLKVRLELLQCLLHYLLFPLQEDIVEVQGVFRGRCQQIDVADIDSQGHLVLTPGQVDLHPFNVAVLELDGEVELCEEGGLQPNVTEHELPVE